MPATTPPEESGTNAKLPVELTTHSASVTFVSAAAGVEGTCTSPVGAPPLSTVSDNPPSSMPNTFIYSPEEVLTKSPTSKLAMTVATE